MSWNLEAFTSQNPLGPIGLQWRFFITGLDMPLGLQEVEAPRFLDNRHMKEVRLLTLSIDRLYPQDISLLLISVRG
jgi:hypothetical protein